MLRLRDKFADDFDIKFNCGELFAMHIGKRFSEQCKGKGRILLKRYLQRRCRDQPRCTIVGSGS